MFPLTLSFPERHQDLVIAPVTSKPNFSFLRARAWQAVDKGREINTFSLKADFVIERGAMLVQFLVNHCSRIRDIAERANIFVDLCERDLNCFLLLLVIFGDALFAIGFEFITSVSFRCECNSLDLESSNVPEMDMLQVKTRFDRAQNTL